MSPKMSPTFLLHLKQDCDILRPVVTHCKHAERLTTPNGKTIEKRWYKMGLKILKDMDGKPRSTWYGRVSVKGKKKEANLEVPIEGVVPMDAQGRILLSSKGDALFEKSRKAAQKAFEKWRREMQKDPAELQRKAYKARTGESLDGLPLARLYEKWQGQKRGYKPTDDWGGMVKKWFERFAAFAGTYAAKHGGRCETVNDITPELAGAWFDEIKRTYAWETVLKMMGTMRGAFRRYSTSGRANPFEDIVMRNRETDNARVNRKPLTADETERLFKCSRNDSEIHPLIVAAACTGMRIGDVCRLKWADVDLSGGFIDCVTAKAGRPVTIPIFARLAEVLKEREAISGDGTPPSPFVFPSAAAQYKANPTALYEAVKPYFALAVYGDTPEAETVTVAENGTAEVQKPRPIAEVIETAGFTEAKRNRILEVYRRFKAGERSSDIAAALQIARSQVSMDLRDAERLTGEALRPLAAATARRKSRLDLIERTRAKRGIGKCQASLYGWHSLRATFVVLAVEAGVPLADVQKVVGHSTTEMTMQYFNPERKHAAERLKRQMRGSVLDGRRNAPRLAEETNAGAVAVPKRNIDELLAALSEDERKALARRLLEM